MMRANKPLRDWHGKHVWIVGASSGIGAALAEELLRHGARVAVSGRREALLQSLFGGERHAIPVVLDACSETSWREASTALRQHWAQLDLVVLCQGDYTPMQVDSFDAGIATRMLEVNLLSLYRGLEFILPWLKQGHGGGIAIMASVAGYGMLPKAMVYGAGKAAARYLAESLYYELAPRGHGVWCINPGFVATRLTAQNDFSMPALMTPQQAARAIVDGFAAGRFDIHFPRRFTVWLKLIALLPLRLQQALIRRLTGV